MLDKAEVPYKLTTHAPVYTSQEAADIRGVDLKSGAKAIVLASPVAGKKEERQFHLAVLSANNQFNSKSFRKLIKSKKLRFATDKEVYEVSGCLRGAVPPFGSLFARPIQTYVDRSLS